MRKPMAKFIELSYELRSSATFFGLSPPVTKRLDSNDYIIAETNAHSEYLDISHYLGEAKKIKQKILDEMYESKNFFRKITD